MCGICGIWNPGEREQELSLVQGMVERLRSRGPDDRGTFHEPPLTLGHTRLAILDLSPAGRQPMHSASGRLVIVFNGEIYNYRELRGELGLEERELASSTDTEILLAAWERWGEQALDRLVGQFAFAVFDRRHERLWLARDRMGEKPLYYHVEPGSGRLCFASTLAALMNVPWVPKQLDPSALYEYLTLRYLVAPRTILREVNKLPPGHLLTIDRHGLRQRCWWRPRFRSAIPGASARRTRETVEHFDELLRQACRRCLVSDVPVALLLSDGIDSHAIRSTLGQLGSKVQAFTFFPASGTPTPKGLEFERQAREHAEVLRASPETLLEHLPEALGALSEPVGDGASLATWFLIRRARPSATVFLCGHGGDEIFAGYRLSQERFRLAALRHLGRWPLPGIDGVIDRYTFGSEPTRVRKQRLIDAGPGDYPAIARYLIHQPLPGEDLRALLGDCPPGVGYLGSIDRLYEDCDEESGDLDRMQSVLIRTFLSSNILSFADSVAMASAAEMRMPYLDRDLVEFALGLPRDLRVSRWPGHANTKLILRRWATAHLDPKVVRRKKHTFNYGTLREALGRPKSRKMLEDILLESPSLRRSVPGLEAWIRRGSEHFHGPREGTLWALTSLAAWSTAAGL